MLSLAGLPSFAVLTPLVATYTGNGAGNPSAASFTSGAIAIGAADPERHVLIALVGWADNVTFNTVTIGGVAASPVGSRAMHTNSGNNATIQYWIAKVPTGTTATVSVTCSAVLGRWAIAAWRLMGLQSTTVISEADTGNADPMTVSINAPDRGAVFGCAMVPTTATFTWTGITEDADNIQMATTNRVVSVAHSEFSPGVTGLSITADQSANSAPAAMKVVTLR